MTKNPWLTTLHRVCKRMGPMLSILIAKQKKNLAVHKGTNEKPKGTFRSSRCTYCPHSGHMIPNSYDCMPSRHTVSLHLNDTLVKWVLTSKLQNTSTPRHFQFSEGSVQLCKGSQPKYDILSRLINRHNFLIIQSL